MKVFTNETTNDLIDKITSDIDVLITLVEANCNHAKANRALGVAKDDAKRIAFLQHARSYMQTAKR
jgi:hypothetical protein